MKRLKKLYKIWFLYGGEKMIGDKYIVKQDCFDGIHNLIKGEILTEKEAYNFETKCREDGGEYNELTHDIYGFVCEVGSNFTKKFLEKCS